MTLILEREPTSLAAAFEHWFTHKPGGPQSRWAVYSRLLEEAPVFRYNDNHIFLSRYEDCNAVLLDHEHFENGMERDGFQVRRVLALLGEADKPKYHALVDHQLRWLTSSNGARHTELRNFMARFFSPRAIAAMGVRIREEIDNRLAELSQQHGPVELISQFAYRLPLTIISEMLGVPVAMREEFHHAWMRMMIIVGQPPEKIAANIQNGYEGMMAIESLVEQLIRDRRSSPSDDLVGAMVEAQKDIEIGDRELIGLVTQLVLAGHQTTQDLIGNTVLTLLGNPDQWRLLKLRPELVPGAVEEILRYRAPAQASTRTANREFTLREETFPAGTIVTCLLGAANRDPAIFADPDRFDIERPNAKLHLSFARGVHFCIGAGLSRLEATSFLSSFILRFPNARLCGSQQRWMPNTVLLGLEALEVDLQGG